MTVAMGNIFNILAVTILALAWNISLLKGVVAASGLVAAPLWDVSKNDTDPCLVTAFGNVTLFRGSASHACGLNVTSAQDVILLEIQGRDSSVEPSYLYVERVGDLEECPNKYEAFNEKTELCSSVFIHSNLKIVLQGNISVSVSSIPAMERSPKCPEVEWDTFESEVSEVSQISVCKNVKGFDDIVKCESYDNGECRINFETDCDTILGPNEVAYQCNDGLHTHTVLIIYSLEITSLDLSQNNLIELQAKSFHNILSNLEELNLLGNRLSALDIGLFNGLHALLFLDLSRNRLRDMSEELFWDLNNLSHLLLERNELTSIPHRLFKNLVNLKTLNLAHNQITELDAELFFGLSSLEELHLNTNEVSQLDGELFNNLRQLKELHLNKNYLHLLPNRLFENMINLEELSLHENQITVLDEELLQGLVKLKYLDLYGNMLSSLSQRPFHSLTNMIGLFLYDNQIIKLDEKSFHDLKKLVVLSLGNNMLRSLPDRLFFNLTNLEDLQLHKNQITKLTNKVFNGLSSLLGLLLNGNLIISLSDRLFSSLSSLWILKLNDNLINSLPDRLFSSLSSLWILHLNDNLINSLPDGLFSRLSSLRELYLDGNLLTSLPDGLFRGLRSLVCLELTDNMITSLPAGLFSGLSSLQDLQLNHNSLTSFPVGLFSRLSSLKWLYFSNNLMTSLPAGLLSGLSSLYFLELCGNMITSLPVGLFNGLSHLEYLCLYSNLLTSLPVGLFNGLSHLQELYLFANLIPSLSVGLFSRLNSLQQLYLNDNLITILPRGLFSGLSILWRLYLPNNSLTSLPDGLFIGLSNLRELGLSGNSLTSLPDGLLNGLSNLEKLDLSGNSLTSLPDGLLNGLSNLEKLDLSGNSLTSLPDGIFQDLTRLFSLDLYNPLLSTLPKYYCASFENLTKLERVYVTINQPFDQVDAFNASLFAMFRELKNFDHFGVQTNMTHEIFSQPELFEELGHLSELQLYLTKLDFLNAEMCDGFVRLTQLQISDTRLTELPSGCFQKVVHLYYLDLSSNQLKSLDSGTFQSLANLYYLYLRNNHLTHLDYELFAYTDNLLVIDLSLNRLTKIPNMKHLVSLLYLDIRNNLLSLLSQESLSFLLHNTEVIVSQHEVCECYVPANVVCTPTGNRSPYLTCNSLLSGTVFVVIIWVIGLNAVVGNLFVLLWRRKTSKKNKVNSILLGNLAASDLLMGIYMIIIGSADIHFGENFPMHAESWRSGITCRFAGALSITSSEASVFFVTLISIDRFICIRFPYTTKRLRERSAVIIALLIWVTSLILGIVPSVLAGANFKFYDNSHVCIGLPLALTKLYSTDRVLELVDHDVFQWSYSTQYIGLFNGLYFSTAVFLGLNFICYLIIAGCYIDIMRSVRKSSKQAGRTRNMAEQIRLTTKVSAIVATDFCCWFPIIILGVLVQTRVITLPVSVFAWCVSFVLPINSAINPYLYTIAEVISNYRKERAENIKMQDILANQKQNSAIPNAAQPAKGTTNTNVTHESKPVGHNHDKMTTQI